ncbi:MAG: FHA domain-containing protein [Woeseiaceae bacterium]|nr:FHA domain-containing protein [Woeseiaceae bacterium]NIP21055.1 FHA domain-containing protein [Woeseiaceae bacterium]NIS90027.1 FHA domain-containing protein [Woeseiaceae bacterium]
MALLAINLNDAAISVQDSNRILYREPGIALLEDDRLVTGLAAFSAARLKPRRIHNAYWSDLKTTPLADRRFQHLSAADIVSRQLEQIWRQHSGDGIVAAVPAYMDTDNLGLLLGIAAELKIPVAGMVDAGVAATRREYQGAVPVHVDLSLHSALLTRLTQAGHVQVDRSEVVEGCGVIALYEAWIAQIAEAFVQQSRFDPLHTAETEQMLQDSLQGWLAAASAADSVDLEIDYRGISHAATIDSLELVATAAPVYHRIVSSLRALYRADETPALQLSDRAARMPGLADILTARVGGEIYLLEPGATGRGLLARCRDMKAGDAAVSLIRKLPWDQSPVESKDAGAARSAGQPTHVLFENRAYAIGADPLMLGSQPGEGDRRIDLRRDMPGVSRQHCSLQQENGQCIVRDFSRYGTFLNGHRIDGSAVLQIGDLVRLGTPGFELRLITTEIGDGP